MTKRSCSPGAESVLDGGSEAAISARDQLPDDRLDRLLGIRHITVEAR